MVPVDSSAVHWLQARPHPAATIGGCERRTGAAGGPFTITSDNSIVIRLDDVRKRFAGINHDAVSGLSIGVAEGELVALIGPSGCGKTTTLRMINRLIEPTAGVIEIRGQNIANRPVAELRRGIGYVIQQVGLFPHRTIAQNIATVPKVLGWDKQRMRARIEELAQLVGLDETLLDRFPDELSGGQQQRVGVARALAADPPVLLMDEPFGAVDPIVRARLQDELLALQRRLHKTIVFVTHDIDEAIKLADRVALLNVGGVLEQYDVPDEILRNPASVFVQEFVGDDRSIKRLALRTVRELSFVRGPVVDQDASASDALAVMQQHRTDWFGVTGHDRFLGWVPRSDLLGNASVKGLATEPPAAQVTPDSTLRDAMEIIMTSHTSHAVVDDGGSFGGVVTLELIRACLDGEVAT